jgi:hypothetical protein
MCELQALATVRGTSTAKLIHLNLFGDDLTTTLRDICFDFVHFVT